MQEPDTIVEESTAELMEEAESLPMPAAFNAGVPQQKLIYQYDWMGRRVSKAVSNYVVGLVNAATGQWAAQYEYGPFGEPIRATGPVAFVNPFRFSTKYCDDETGRYYYGYRDYSPTQGRWLSREPIGEYGGINLYNFLRNNPVTELDPLGLWNLLNPATWGDRNPTGWSLWNSLTPWHESSGYTWEGIKWNTGQAAQATLDGIIPFWDPFSDNGGYDMNDPMLALSRDLGEAARDIYLGKCALKGKELSFGKNFRLALFGNRTKLGQPFDWKKELPHYHRRGAVGPRGQTPPGQGIGRHRPWESSKHDGTWKERF